MGVAANAKGRTWKVGIRPHVVNGNVRGKADFLERQPWANLLLCRRVELANSDFHLTEETE